MSQWGRLLREELQSFHPRLVLVRLLLAPLPLYVGSRVRAAMLRRIGFSIGHGTVIWGTPTITGGSHLHEMLVIGEYCWINVGCFLNVDASIVIGDGAAVGHQVMLLTMTHQIGDNRRRAGALVAEPITIGQGAWLGSRCTILPGVTVGDGAVVAAGAVVTKNVPSNTLVAGVPAKVIRQLN